MESLFHGIPVVLLTESRTAPGTWNLDRIDNVLVAPYAETDGTRTQQPQGHAAVYHLGIPKTDSHKWEGALVQFFGSTWAVVGMPTKGIEHLVPGPWNKKVLVEFYRTGAPDVAGLWVDQVELRSVASYKDGDGYDVGLNGSAAFKNAIFTEGVNFAQESESDKLGPRRRASVELWQRDYNNQAFLNHDDVLYNVISCKQTGRGSVMLQVEEVWR